MFSKFFTTIFLGIGLVAFSFSNNYSMEKKEEVKKEEKKEVSEAERAYYKDHPWDFVEKKFVEEPYQLDAKPTSDLHKKELKIYSSISSIYWTLLALLLKFGQSGDERHDMPFWGGMALFTLVPLTPIIGLLHWYLDARYKKILYLEKEIDILISILKDFDSKLDNDSKELLPEDLHKTFASLRAVYDKEGRDGVKREWGKVHQHIKDKLMYDVKKSKYVKPVINNYNYNYNTNYNSTN